MIEGNLATCIDVLAFIIHDTELPDETYIEPTPEAYAIAQQTLIDRAQAVSATDPELEDLLLMVAGALS